VNVGKVGDHLTSWAITTTTSKATSASGINSRR